MLGLSIQPVFIIRLWHIDIEMGIIFLVKNTTGIILSKTSYSSKIQVISKWRDLWNFLKMGVGHKPPPKKNSFLAFNKRWPAIYQGYTTISCTEHVSGLCHFVNNINSLAASPPSTPFAYQRILQNCDTHTYTYQCLLYYLTTSYKILLIFQIWQKLG